MRQIITGRVLQNIKRGKNKNELFLEHSELIRVILSDKDAEGISSNDYVQITGSPQKDCKIVDGVAVAYDLLITEPVVDRIIRRSKIK